MSAQREYESVYLETRNISADYSPRSLYLHTFVKVPAHLAATARAHSEGVDVRVWSAALLMVGNITS